MLNLMRVPKLILHFDGQSLSLSWSLKVRVFGSLRVVFTPYPLTTTISQKTLTNLTYSLLCFVEIEARKAQQEAKRIQLQQEEEADLREQERLEKEEEERLAREAEEARLEEVRRQEEAREVVQH